MFDKHVQVHTDLVCLRDKELKRVEFSSQIGIDPCELGGGIAGHDELDGA